MSARTASKGPHSHLYATNACLAARCGRQALRWVPTAKIHPRTGAPLGSGAPIPLDVGRDPGGPVVLDQDPRTAQWTVRPFDPDRDPADRPRYTVHWSSCHTPDLYREVKSAADPRGILPTLNARGGRTTAGPCSTCGTHHDPHYGPGGCPLCDDCARAAIARWSPAMRAQVEGWPDTLRRRLGV